MNHDELIAEIEEKIKELAPLLGGQFYSGTFRKALAALAEKDTRIAELEAELLDALDSRDKCAAGMKSAKASRDATLKRAEDGEELLTRISPFAGLAHCAGYKCRLPHCDCCWPEDEAFAADEVRVQVQYEISAHLAAVAKGKEGR